jgi:hypothetical protein
MSARCRRQPELGDHFGLAGYGISVAVADALGTLADAAVPKQSKPAVGCFRGGQNAKEIAHHKIINGVVMLLVTQNQYERGDSNERQGGPPEICGQAQKGTDQERYHVVLEVHARPHEHGQQRHRHGNGTKQQRLSVSFRRAGGRWHAQGREGSTTH